MKPDRKILEYGNRKNEILKLINKCELEKIRVKVSIQELWLKYLAREITLSDYKEKSNKILKNRSVDSWTKYLDECINYYKKDIKNCDRLIQKEQKLNVITPIMMIAIILLGTMVALFMNPKLTGFVIFENESNTTLENAQINETLINNFTDLINNETNLTSILITNLSTNVINQTNDIQLSAEINKPVKWVRILSTNKNGKSLKLRNGASNILVSNLDSGIPVDITNKISIKQNNKFVDLSFNDNFDMINVSYETPGPIANETKLENGKRVVITSESELNYTDVLAYSNLDNRIKLNNAEKIKIYWKANYDDAVRYGYINKIANVNSSNETYTIEIPFRSYDLDKDGNIDRVEWIVPHLSEQIYEIIYITNAIELDENRNFLRDSYDYVKTKDNNWTTISYGHFLRVTFEKNLTNKNDITIYARTNDSSGNSMVDVFRENENSSIARFINIGNEGWNKIYLTNLGDNENYNVFDLRSLGDIEYDYVVDPTSGPNQPYNVVNDTSNNGANWTTPINAQSTNGINATATAPKSATIGTAYLKATNYSFNIPTGATIDGITVTVKKATTNSARVTDSEVKIVKSEDIKTTNHAILGQWIGNNNGGMNTTVYGSATDKWGETWTAEDINNASFGVVFSAISTNAGTGAVRVDSILITVDYTAAGGDNNAPTYVSGSVIANQTTIYQNQFINFTANWTDNVALDHFIFEINQSGTWVNSSVGVFTATTNISSNVTKITASSGTNVSWRFWANDTSNNWNVTSLQSFIVVVPDTTLPLWIDGSILKNESVVIQNEWVNFTTNWTDNVALDHFIFEINQSGTWVNSSVGVFTANTNISSNVTKITAAAGTNVSWRFWANDTSGNWNVTNTQSFVVQSTPDTTKPLWIAGSILFNDNNYITQDGYLTQDDPINFTTNWTDNSLLGYFIFELNQSGSWVNSSVGSFSSNMNISNNLSTISALYGTNVSWRFWANDTSGNLNVTSIQSTIVQNPLVCGTPCVYCTNNNILATACTTPGRQCDGTNSIENISLSNYTIASGSQINVTIDYSCWGNPASTDNLALWYYNGTGWRLIQYYDIGSLTGCDTISDGADGQRSVIFTPDSIVGVHYVRAIDGDTGERVNSSSCPAMGWGNVDDKTFKVIAASQNNVPTILSVSPIASQTITESSTTNVTFSYIVNLDSGTQSLKNDTAIAMFNMSGYGSSRQASCSRTADINDTRANYTCGVLIWYFDNPSAYWAVNVNVTDNNGNYAFLNSSFTLQSTTSITFSPQSLGWNTIMSGTKNQTSANDPILINNIGNTIISNGNIRITAFNLIGVQDTSKYIPAANFSVYNNTGSNRECAPSSAIVLANNTLIGTTGIGLLTGNNTAGQGQQNLYFCLYDVPLAAALPVQTYSTNSSGSWTISVV